MTREQAEKLISMLTREQKLALLGMLEAIERQREATRL